MTHRQIHPLDESGVQPSREAQFLQGGLKICQCPQAHQRRDSHEFATLVAFLHLAVDQLGRHLPPKGFPPPATSLEPVSKMGGQRLEVQV